MSAFDRDTWGTPQYLFNWLNSIYEFDIDLCADSKNSKCKVHFAKDYNSLAQSWSECLLFKTGFCNPPYSNVKPWVKKAIIEANKGFTTVMLIPTPNGESYYQDVFEHATRITFITGRVAFYNPHEKKEIGGNTRGSCVVEFSKKYSHSMPIIDHVLRDELKKGFTYA